MASDTPESAAPATEEQDGTAGQSPDENAGSAAAEEYAPDNFEQGAAANVAPPADVNLDLILDVPVTVSLQVGSADITIRELVGLVEGSVVALERESSEPLDVMVNGTLIAHGEIVVVDDHFGVRLTDVMSPAERIMNINRQ